MNMILEFIGKLLVGTFNTLSETITNAIHSLTQFNDEAIATAKNIGMPFQQSIAYTKVLTTETQRLAIAYGVTAKQISDLQGMMTKATGTAALLNHEQMEGLLQTQKFIESGTQINILEQIDKMGGSVNVANEEMLKFTSTSSKAGIALSKSSADFANNLKLANQYTFASGIDGIAKMTLLSEKLRVDLTSIMNAADTFTEFDSAIKASAEMQNLGGMGAAYAANPLTMMYEGLEDPESLMERMSKMFESMAVFDTKTGTGKISGQNLQIIKAQADALGITKEDAVNMAKNGARANAIQGQMGAKYDQLTDDQQAFLTNKTQWNDKTQKFELNVVENGEIKSKPIDQLTPEQIAQYQKEAAMTTTDAVKEASTQLVTFSERAEGYEAAKSAMMAETMYPMLEELFNLQQNMMQLGIDIMKYFTNLVNPHWWSNIWTGCLEGIEGTATVIWGGIKWIGENLWNVCKWLGDKIMQGIYSLPLVGDKTKASEYEKSASNIHYQTFASVVDPMVAEVKQKYASKYYDDVVSTEGFINEVEEIGKTIGKAATNVAKGFKGKDMTNKMQESLNKIGNPYLGISGDTTNNATSSVTNRPSYSNVNTSSVQRNTNTYSSYSSPVSTNSYAYPQSSTYYAQTSNNGDVNYVSSNQVSKSGGTKAPALQVDFNNVIGAIDKQTDVIVSLNGAAKSVPIKDKFAIVAKQQNNNVITNNNESGYSPEPIYDDRIQVNEQQPVGSVVKGGEVTNGVTPVKSEINAISSTNHSMSFEPLKLDISGTIKLDGGVGNSATIKAEDLLGNSVLLSSLTEKIKEELNKSSLKANSNNMLGWQLYASSVNPIGFAGNWG